MTLPEDRLNALALACERASGPDRTLDCAIYNALFIKPGKWDTCYVAKCYTASLDAAMTLVPDGCLFTARTVWDNEKTAGLAFVSRYEKGEFCGHERLYWMDEHQSVAANPALALTAAALRALALKSGEGKA